MKNKLLLGALLIGIANLFTSCKDDRDDNPTVKSPTAFTVNTPATADQYIQLAADNNINLTWSQPDYGYTANVTYRVQVGVKQDDGSVTWSVKSVKDDDGNVIGSEPQYLASTYYTCNATVSGEEIAMALNEIDGFKTIDDYVDKGFREIAFRVNASLYEVDKVVSGTAIVSEPVFFKHMAAYCAIKSPAYIYIVGDVNAIGWAEPNEANAASYADYRLYETEIDNNVFEGTFDVTAGDHYFRFYTKLTGWDDDSWGPLPDDNTNIPFDFAEANPFAGTIQQGKGSWLLQNFEGGTITFTVNMNDNTVSFVKH
ncbi:MAG: SusE domain-containing protein [Prevotella sp.]|nr:SusE domain-containing protein [Prevotella sp.]